MTQPPGTSLTGLTLLLVGLAGFLISAGCGSGSGQGLDVNGNISGQPNGAPPSGGGGAGTSGNPNATLAWVQDNVFGGICSQCHLANAVFNVNWNSVSATCSNVGRTSAEIPPMKEIESGNPDASYVIWKVVGAGPNGETISGGQMPLNGPPFLSNTTIQNMRDWIADGVPGCPP